MKNFQQKRGFKYLMQTKLFLFILAIVIIFFTFNVIVLVGKMNETIKKRKISEAKVIELQKRKEKLLFDIERLDTDKGKEEVFRENFGLSKEGENMIMIVEEKGIIKEDLSSKNKGFFDFLKNWFK